MVVIYTIPSASYQPGSVPDPTLDEVEILGPPDTIPLSGATDNEKTASLKLQVNGSTFRNVKARITLTRQQDIDNTTATVPAGWSYTGLPNAAPVIEGVWNAQATVLHVGDAPVFSVKFNPMAAGQYRFTYTIEAAELNGPVETYQDVTVTA